MITNLIVILVIISIFTHVIHSFSSKASRVIMDGSRITLMQKVYYYFFPAFELIRLERMGAIREFLSEMPEIEIKNLRVGVNSELDRIKHFAPMAAIMTILITTLLAIFSNIVPLSNTWTTSILNQAINLKVSELESKGVAKDEIVESLLNSDKFIVAPEFGEQISTILDSILFDAIGINFEIFFIISIILVFYWVIHQFRLSKLLKLKYILDDI